MSNSAYAKEFVKDKKKLYASIGIILIIAAVVLVKILLFAFKPYELEYNIKPLSVKDKTISVNFRIKRNSYFGARNFSLIKGAMRLENAKCIDNQSKKISFSDKGGIINIKDVSLGTKYLDFSYIVRIGDMGKHGCRGQMYDDLITFEGESVLVLPIEALGKNEELNIKNSSNIKNISIKYDIPSDWEIVVPFTEKNQNKVTQVHKPNFVDLYDLRKSSYTFGKLEKEQHKTKNGSYTLYVDPLAKEFYTEDAEKGITSLFNYYSSLFGYELDDFSIVLLRKDKEERSYILGGSSRKNQATTFDPNSLRDWQLMSHRLFHSYFEKKIDVSDFNMPPQLWFYEGMATYYENIAAGNLPENIRAKVGIDVSSYFSDLFNRFVYMRFKEPVILSMAPMEELKNSNSLGKIEFLHYTQAPLVIKYIEDLNQNKGQDNLLKFIIKHAEDKNSLKTEEIIKSVMGNNYEEFSKKYLFGTKIVPLWNLQGEKENEVKHTVKELNDFEYNLYTWFRQENKYYLNDIITESDLDKLCETAEKKNIYFAQEDMEKKVKTMSPTVYKLLKQYALRANVCGIDLKDNYARGKLLYDMENVFKWEKFKEQ